MKYSISKLSAHKSAQAIVVTFEDGTIQLVSYRTPVIELRPNGYVYALSYFNCSASTRRHVGWFLREYTDLTYSYIKQPALDGYAIHANYGDMIPV